MDSVLGFLMVAGIIYFFYRRDKKIKSAPGYDPEKVKKEKQIIKQKKLEKRADILRAYEQNKRQTNQNDIFPKIAERYYTKIVGVTFNNSNGSSRQAIINKCKVGERLYLKHTPIKEDVNAVVVLRKNNEQLGHIKAEMAVNIAKQLDKGEKIGAVITEITGGQHGKKTLGCNIDILYFE